MFWLVLLTLLAGFLLFKFGMLAVWTALLEGLLKLLLVISGAFLLVYGGRAALRRRRMS